MSDLHQLRDLYHKSLERFIQGDPNAQKPLWSQHDDVTLANPLGPPAKGFDQVCQAMDSAAAQISEGEGYTFETIAVVETAGLAYEVAIEHARAKLGDAGAMVPISLRVTTVFRLEEGGWKIVHRHADPITQPKSIQSVARAGGPA